MYELKLDLDPLLKKMELMTRKEVLGATGGIGGAQARQVGSKHAMFKSKGLEFQKFREYAPSDDANKIDWIASLRASKVLIRVYSEEQTKDIIFFLDVSSSMSYSSFGKLKNEFAAELIASLSHALSNSGDPLGLTIFTNKIVHHLSPNVGPQQHQKIVKTLTDPTFYEGKYDLIKSLSQLVGMLKKKTVIILISDFIGLQDNWEHSFKGIATNSNIMGIMIRDPLDDVFPEGHFVGQVVLSDPFSDDEALIDPNKVREKYEEHNKKKTEEIEHAFKSTRSEFIKLYTNESFIDPMRKFFLNQ
ncbi:DUF58 domain-containing protein [Candidatus Woesearchaeota archaeon]|nr:DUF58 domain-containing protein [Candidatus Woesearchaeota archaeon]